MAESNGTHGEEPWVMPKVEVGQIVLWAFNQVGTTPSPAVVMSVGRETVNLCVHTMQVKDHIFKTGARHKDDPWLRKNSQHDGGVWMKAPIQIRIEQMLAAFEAKQADRVARGTIYAGTEAEE